MNERVKQLAEDTGIVITTKGMEDIVDGCYIVGIKGHGVVAIDTSPWRAYEHIERLEHIARIVLASGNY